MTKKQWYDDYATMLQERSTEICADNGCTEDEHKCESLAYFDYDTRLGAYRLFDICLSDYMPRSTTSFICMPFTGSGTALLKQLQDNDERDPA
jgi:hypothetical protein